MAATMSDMGTVEEEPRRLRADAQRNRRRLLEAATELFSERGLEVGVAEIAAHAGVGRGTLFRNFPSKEHLIAAIVVERMRESIARAPRRSTPAIRAAALFELIDSAIERSADRPRAVRCAVGHVAGQPGDPRPRTPRCWPCSSSSSTRAQAAGAVRDDISRDRVVIMIKGVCEARASSSTSARRSPRASSTWCCAAISTHGAAAEAPRPAADGRGLRAGDDLHRDAAAVSARRRRPRARGLAADADSADAARGRCRYGPETLGPHAAAVSRRDAEPGAVASRRTGPNSRGRPDDGAVVAELEDAGVVTTPPRTPERKSRLTRSRTASPRRS